MNRVWQWMRDPYLHLALAALVCLRFAFAGSGGMAEGEPGQGKPGVTCAMCEGSHGGWEQCPLLLETVATH